MTADQSDTTQTGPAHSLSMSGTFAPPPPPTYVVGRMWRKRPHRIVYMQGVNLALPKAEDVPVIDWCDGPYRGTR